jgi:DNA-binding MarR family transcriptional regulator
MSPTGKQTAPDYQALAEFRYRIRRFLRFSEQAARAAGLEPQQHQLLLALKGLPGEKKRTISALAERLQIEHHSTVELIDRLEERHLIRRSRDKFDRRQVLVSITAKGEEILEHLSLHHLDEIQSVGPDLARVLSRLLSRLSSGERRLKAVNDK